MKDSAKKGITLRKTRGDLRCDRNFVPFAALLLCLVSSLHAQPAADSALARPDITFTQLFLEEGLSQSIVQCIAQDNKGFMWFGTEDGLNRYDGYRFTVFKHDPNDPSSLSYSEITALHVDGAGNLWIGTFNGGVNRYDPRTEHFERIQNDPDNPESLSNNIINVIFEDSKGALWFGTDKGLNRLVPAETGAGTGKFVRFLHDPQNPHTLTNDSVKAICEDSSGALWIGTDAGLAKFDRDTGLFTRFSNKPDEKGSLGPGAVTALMVDENTLWIGTQGGGVNKLDLKNPRPLFVRYTHRAGDPRSLSHDQVNVIFQDRDDRLWIGTNGGGLNLFDRPANAFTTYRHNPTIPRTLSYDQVMAIYEDRSGLLWIGTYGGGIDKINRTKKQFALYAHDPDNPNSLGHQIVWAVHEDKDGILWVGTHGGGLDRFDRKKNIVKHYRHIPGDPGSLSNNVVRIVYEDTSGTLWIGTNGGGLNRFDRKTETFEAFLNDPGDPASLSHNELRAIFEDGEGTLWIGTNGAGLNKLVPAEEPGAPPEFLRCRHDPSNPNSLSNDFVRFVFEDSKRILWIGTQGGGLNRFDRDRATFTHYRADPDDPQSLNNDFVFAIHEDRDANLWLGTWGGGLNKFDRESNTFSHYTMEDGLPNDAIYAIVQDKEGNYWLSTNNGISKFNPREETFRNYTIEDGLQSNEFNGGSFFKNPDTGEIFFGGIKGLNAFYPEKITDNPHKPPVVITSFQKLNQESTFDKPFSEIKELTLSYQDYVFSLEFAALDFTAPEKNLYAYKMEGLDEDWIFTDAKKRFATYTTLAPGKYTFKVRGSNSDGKWNEKETSLDIIITPPFWKTWWFTLIWLAFAAALMARAYQRRLKTVQLRAELQAAHDAQMAIMPQQDPDIKGLDISGICIPANEVGGDFFDYIRSEKDESKILIALGDVSGKAMKSAMMAVMSNGMIYARSDEDLPVKEIMTRLNAPLISKTAKKMFVALCLAAFNSRKKSLTFTNAGLPRPILKSGSTAELIEGKDPRFPLGAVADTVYQEKTVQLSPGNVVVFYSDGISEAHNPAGELYGDATLVKLLLKTDSTALPASKIKKTIIADVQRFAGSAEQNDDMTIVVVKVL
ncbi:two-component regulator propeller domain-containing protein [Acidobacteriota bacterium]